MSPHGVLVSAERAQTFSNKFAPKSLIPHGGGCGSFRRGIVSFNLNSSRVILKETLWRKYFPGREGIAFRHQRRLPTSSSMRKQTPFLSPSLTSSPLSLLSSSAFRAEQLMVWYVTSAAAANREVSLLKSCSSSASNWMVLMSIGYPEYL